jgi:LacI family transcriptional regulator
MADIAREAGVSKATVSRVLNGHAAGVGPDTRQRVKAVMERMGFEPSGVARGLATGKSRSVGLVIPDVADPFCPLLIRGIEDTLRRRGYGLFLCDSDRDLGKENEHIRMLLEKGVDGVILNSTSSDCDCQLDLLDRRPVPYVLLDRPIEARPTGAGVHVDNRKGARLGADWLLGGGARRLLFINGPAGLSVSKLRRLGVEDAFRDRGLDPGALLCGQGDLSVASGERAVEALLAGAGGRCPFDAVFAACDMMAIGAMRALKRHGLRIPLDVEVAGFDDVEPARLVEPALTTVAQPAFRMGQQSAELLLRLIDGQKPRKRTIVMEPALVIRESTRPRQSTTPQGEPHHG